MRRSTRLTVTVLMITGYYVVAIALFVYLARSFPQLEDYLPVGGIAEMINRGDSALEVIVTKPFSGEGVSYNAIQLSFAMIGTVILMVPVSWVYFITTRTKNVDPSFSQTIVVLPVVVTGIAMIVQNSLALAFSLAGVVAAVRFRFTLAEPAHALYIFAAIGVGLGSGIGALGVSTVISIAFVYINLLLWKLDYGANLGGPFFSFLTGRDRDEEDI